MALLLCVLTVIMAPFSTQFAVVIISYRRWLFYAKYLLTIALRFNCTCEDNSESSSHS